MTEKNASSSAAQRAWATRKREPYSGKIDPANAVETAVVKAAKSALARVRRAQLEYDLKLPAAMLEACRQQGSCCQLSGSPFTMEVFGDGAAPRPFAPSVDRISSSAGYTVENCRLVCWAVNSFLGVWGTAIAIEIARGIVSVADAGTDKGLT